MSFKIGLLAHGPGVIPPSNLSQLPDTLAYKDVVHVLALREERRRGLDCDSKLAGR